MSKGFALKAQRLGESLGYEHPASRRDAPSKDGGDIVAVCEICGKYRASLGSKTVYENGQEIIRQACAECSGGKTANTNGCIALIIAIAIPAVLVLSYCSPHKDASVSDTPEAKSTASEPSPAMLAISAKVDAETNLKSSLKDGDSAKFSNEFVSRLSGGNLMLCGEVNSKNSFGGYTGRKRFIASANPEAPDLLPVFRPLIT